MTLTVAKLINGNETGYSTTVRLTVAHLSATMRETVAQLLTTTKLTIAQLINDNETDSNPAN